MPGLAFGSQIAWTLSEEGAYVGPPENKQGNLVRHSLVLDLAYAPGDSDGYYKDIDSDSELSITKRSNQANAIRIHPNFTPTMILFNSYNYLADLNLDGIFDYQAIMNAQLISWLTVMKTFNKERLKQELVMLDFQARLLMKLLIIMKTTQHEQI